jgi:pimeloyl-ACP methyl ester carboxylesterase
MDAAPFKVDVPQAAIDDLHARLSRTRWPDELPGCGWAYGVPLEHVKRLAELWRTRYDWRTWERRLNSYPQFTTEIDGQIVHFVHVRSGRPGALPLILTQGWPGSVVEYLDVIEPLSNPRAESGAAAAFDLVIPSLPGFAFSGPTREPGWGPDRVARAWVALMHGLGYDRYGAVGTDWGSHISPLVGRFDPDSVVGVHVTQMYLYPSGDEEELSAFAEEDLQAMLSLKWFNDNLSAYDALQSQQPQTLAFALTDSPAGLLAWLCQVYREGVDDEFVLTNASIYWLTETAASAARIYYENAHASRRPEGPTTTPTGLAMFSNDFRTFRTLAARAHGNLVHWSEFDVAGHWAAHQAPEVWAADVRKFFGSLARRRRREA